MGKGERENVTPFARRVNERAEERGDGFENLTVDGLMKIQKANLAAYDKTSARLKAIYGDISTAPMPERGELQKICVDGALIFELLDKKLTQNEQSKLETEE